ncbi:unnamed protein product [Brugia timori]|uniref:Uncharacterized protein n=1 Tax=Brugia timori TaxID=42155 RepID=A0A0R3R9X5_9BILA|nr:unnamed protein product [Brugia timori]
MKKPCKLGQCLITKSLLRHGCNAIWRPIFFGQIRLRNILKETKE